MADYERTVLDFYQLSTPFPSEWPEDRNDKDDESSGDERGQSSKLQRRKSRYQALERAAGDRRTASLGT